MFTINVVGLNKVKKNFENSQKQIKFATALALTKTAKKVKKHAIADMLGDFDNPTPFTINAFWIKAAKRDDKNPTAEVRIKDNPSRLYLDTQILGGKRKLKRSEYQLRSAGHLPTGMVTAPGAGLKLNRFGNMSRGQISKILLNLNAQSDSLANTTDNKKRRYFVSHDKGKTRGFSRGVWLRSPTGKKIKPVLMFIKEPTYEAEYFDFYFGANRTVNRELEKQFIKAYKFATKTAR